MTYDYHGYWDGQTGHVSPLFHSESSNQYNSNSSMEYWVSLGAERHQLVMGLPLYGQTFTLADPNQNSVGSPSLGRGDEGPATRAAGFMAYHEICLKIREDGWTKVSDPQGHQGPYAFFE